MFQNESHEFARKLKNGVEMAENFTLLIGKLNLFVRFPKWSIEILGGSKITKLHR